MVFEDLEQLFFLFWLNKVFSIIRSFNKQFGINVVVLWLTYVTSAISGTGFRLVWWIFDPSSIFCKSWWTLSMRLLIALIQPINLSNKALFLINSLQRWNIISNLQEDFRFLILYENSFRYLGCSWSTSIFLPPVHRINIQVFHNPKRLFFLWFL